MLWLRTWTRHLAKLTRATPFSLAEVQAISRAADKHGLSSTDVLNRAAADNISLHEAVEEMLEEEKLTKPDSFHRRAAHYAARAVRGPDWPRHVFAVAMATRIDEPVWSIEIVVYGMNLDFSAEVRAAMLDLNISDDVDWIELLCEVVWRPSAPGSSALVATLRIIDTLTSEEIDEATSR